MMNELKLEILAQRIARFGNLGVQVKNGKTYLCGGNERVSVWADVSGLIKAKFDGGIRFGVKYAEVFEFAKEVEFEDGHAMFKSDSGVYKISAEAYDWEIDEDGFSEIGYISTERLEKIMIGEGAWVVGEQCWASEDGVKLVAEVDEPVSEGRAFIPKWVLWVVGGNIVGVFRKGDLILVRSDCSVLYRDEWLYEEVKFERGKIVYAFGFVVGKLSQGEYTLKFDNEGVFLYNLNDGNKIKLDDWNEGNYEFELPDLAYEVFRRFVLFAGVCKVHENCIEIFLSRDGFYKAFLKIKMREAESALH